MAWAAVGAGISGITGLLGSKKARKEAKAQREFQREQNEIARTAFNPIPVTGLGGSGVTFGGDGSGGLQSGQVDFNQLANTGTQAPPQPTSSLIPDPGQTLQQPQTIQIPGGGTVTLPPGTISGQTSFPQGGTATSGTNTGSINLNAGDLDPAAAGARQIGTQNIGRAGLAQNADQDPTVQAIFGAFQNQGADAGISNALGVQDRLLQGAGQVFQGAEADVLNQQQNPFQQQLLEQLFGQSQEAFGAIPGTQQEARQQQLDLLRQQAQPFEDRAFSGLQENLFGTGRFGTSGGGLQTEAFARGLAQADIDRQLVAGQEGRNAQNSQLNLASTLLGSGSGLRTLQDSLLTNAQNRFAGTANLSQSLSNTRQGLEQTQFGNLAQLLQNAFAPQQLAQQLQSGFLNNASAALGINSGVQADALSLANFGLDTSATQANARLSGVSSAGAPPASGGNIFSQISAATAPEGGIFQTIGDVISSRTQTGQPDQNTGIVPNPGAIGI